MASEGGSSGAGRALSFGPAAALYERARPGYPAAIVAWLLGPAPRLVAELGAGTGKFTRALAAAGHRVLAIEPDHLMARQLRASGIPGVRVLQGMAEALPLPDQTVDAVVAAQAWHWFELDATYPELARVVRPAGVVAAVWNLRDESVPWVADLSRIVGSEDVRRPEPAPVPGFGPWEVGEARHTTVLTAESLQALVATRSFYLTACDRRRAEADQGLRELAVTLPPEFDLPYRTVAFRAVRAPAAAAAIPPERAP
jgi:SAM-dependent methyltransferase